MTLSKLRKEDKYSNFIHQLATRTSMDKITCDLPLYIQDLVR